MRIGVFGGSFDPVHHGHLIAALEAQRVLGLDEVRLVPAREQPFKRGRHGAPAADRLAMLRLAVRDEPALVADPRELDRPGPSYTIDTLRSLKAEFPGAELSLLVGADTIRDFGQWRQAEAIFGEAAVVVVSRPGADPGEADGRVRRVTIPAIEISSTGIRGRVRAGLSVRFLVPDAVAEYIAERQLYVNED